MRRLTASVVLVTGCDDGVPFGMAATSCSAMCAEPPSVVVGVNRAASLHAPIRKGRAFGINLLGESDRDLVTLFSDGTRRGDRFAGDRWVIGDQGVPILIDAVMALSCRVDAEFEYGSHSLFVGKVADVWLGPGSDALLWRDGRFARATDPWSE